MGLDCRAYLAVKEYEFLLNWFIAQHRAFWRQQEQAVTTTEHTPLAVKDTAGHLGFSAYDYFAQHTVTQAAQVFLQHFGKELPPIVYTNLFHLAEVELKPRHR
jgi:hypothetical protein